VVDVVPATVEVVEVTVLEVVLAIVAVVAVIVVEVVPAIMEVVEVTVLEVVLAMVAVVTVPGEAVAGTRRRHRRTHGSDRRHVRARRIGDVRQQDGQYEAQAPRDVHERLTIRTPGLRYAREGRYTPWTKHGSRGNLHDPRHGAPACAAREFRSR
jgi:hypothetical protein